MNKYEDVSNLVNMRISRLDLLTCTDKPITIKEREIRMLKAKCHEELLDKCKEFAVLNKVPLSSIMNLSAVKMMSETIPSTKEEFLKIQYVTMTNFERFGNEFLDITKKHSELLKQLEVKKQHKYNARTNSRSKKRATRKRKRTTNKKTPEK